MILDHESAESNTNINSAMLTTGLVTQSSQPSNETASLVSEVGHMRGRPMRGREGGACNLHCSVSPARLKKIGLLGNDAIFVAQVAIIATTSLCIYNYVYMYM